MGLRLEHPGRFGPCPSSVSFLVRLQIRPRGAICEKTSGNSYLEQQECKHDLTNVVYGIEKRWGPDLGGQGLDGGNKFATAGRP